MVPPTHALGRSLPAAPNATLIPHGSCRHLKPFNSSQSLHASCQRLREEALKQQTHTLYRTQRKLKPGLVFKARAQGLKVTAFSEDVLDQKLQALAAEVKDNLDGSSLYLVGMMGSGKSTVGKMVAAALEYPYVDSDKLIEERAGRTVAQIFAAQGEQAFRDLESSVLRELAASKAVMVSTGGGVVTREQNWESMRHGLVIWLTGPPELLAKRAVSDGTQSRPLLSQGSSGHTSEGDGAYTATLAKVRDILDKRQHMYAQADLHIPLEGSPGDPSDCGATPAVIAYRLLKALMVRLKLDEAEREAAKAA